MESVARKRLETKAGGVGKRKGKQQGAKGFGPKLSAESDVVVDHRPVECSGCGGVLDRGVVQARRQVVDLPEPVPVVTEHRVHGCSCPCGTVTVGAFPEGVRAPVTYTPQVRAVVVYLLARQHIPVGRARETMRDLYGLDLSPGAINNFYTDAAHRLRGFIAALVAVLRTVLVSHADATHDRVGTETCWMHVVSTKTLTLIHASMTRGIEAVTEMGVLAGYRVFAA